MVRRIITGIVVALACLGAYFLYLILAGWGI